MPRLWRFAPSANHGNYLNPRLPRLGPDGPTAPGRTPANAASQLPDCCAEGGTVTVFLQEAPLDGNPYCQPARVTIASCGFFSKSYLRAPSPWAQGGAFGSYQPNPSLK